MNSYYFNDEISTETVNNLVEKLQSFEGEIDLWFSTNGGESVSMAFLIKYFNSIKDRLTITLADKIWSAGTFILTDYYGKIRIEYNEMDSFLFHVGDRRMHLQSVDRDIEDAKILAKQDREVNLVFAEKIKKKKLLTEKQIKDYLKGKDVLVYKEQFKNWKLC
jgi:hypothetical protein